MVKNIEYLKTQIGNPEGADVPIKTLRSKKILKVKSLSIQDWSKHLQI
jgi:hypothetical protein